MTKREFQKRYPDMTMAMAHYVESQRDARCFNVYRDVVEYMDKMFVVRQHTPDINTRDSNNELFNDLYRQNPNCIASLSNNRFSVYTFAEN